VRFLDDRGSDRGSATLGLVVVFPAFLALLLLVVQAALLAHARNVALAAAQEGLRDARLLEGSRQAGELRARNFLAASGGSLFTGSEVTAVRSTDTASVRVSGEALSLLPAVTLRVQQVAEGPVERFVPDTGGRT
jgi:Flp pilus assembly protein TadG